MPRKPFRLSKPYRWNERTDVAQGGCVFCGEKIQHVNDGGVGWLIAARNSKGMMGEYLYCYDPMCEATAANDRAEIHRCYNPAHGGIVNVVGDGQGWKKDPSIPADDYGSYIEFLGDCCPECGGVVADVDARIGDPKWAAFFAGKEA